MLLAATQAFTQEIYDYASADSVTLKLYLEGNWRQLIRSGKQILKQNIEFKTLDQRIGYAYFKLSDYYKSKKYYEKALAFDAVDEITLLYLYYNGLNTGNKTYARYYEGKLPQATKGYLKSSQIRPVDAFDLEYNYKTASNDLLEVRSAPDYKRMGINSQLGYKLNLYQTLSVYKQDVTAYDVYMYSTKQTEYFALLNITLTPKLNILGGYHYLHTKLDSVLYPGHIFLGKLRYNSGRWAAGVGISQFNSSFNNTFQTEAETGYMIPTNPGIYMGAKVTMQNEPDSVRWTYTGSAGIMLLKMFWIEGKVTLGAIKNYVDMDGLYVYNSIDPTYFRSGISLFWYTGKNITLYTNYTYDKKHYIIATDAVFDDLQHSFTGGIIWKL